MAVLRIPEHGKTLTTHQEIADYLAGCGIEYRYWKADRQVAVDAPPEEILHAYAKEIDELKSRGGYVTADVIDVNQQTPGLEAMLAKFNREHWHSEDEVRFIVAGSGLFHVHPKDRDVVAIEVEAGDLISIPRGTWHWFDLCSDRHIRAIRLFQDVQGWTPNYTDSGVDQNFQPVCLGQTYFPLIAGDPS